VVSDRDALQALAVAREGEYAFRPEFYRRMLPHAEAGPSLGLGPPQGCKAPPRSGRASLSARPPLSPPPGATRSPDAPSAPEPFFPDPRAGDGSRSPALAPEGSGSAGGSEAPSRTGSAGNLSLPDVEGGQVRCPNIFGVGFSLSQASHRRASPSLMSASP